MAVNVATAGLLSIVGLGMVLNMGNIPPSAAEGRANQVAYVEFVTGSVIAFAHGRPLLVEALDSIEDRTQLDLKADSELRMCHYRSGKLLTLHGPLRIVVSAGGIDNAGAVDGESCAKPVVSIFQGGTAIRGIRRGSPAP